MSAQLGSLLIFTPFSTGPEPLSSGLSQEELGKTGLDVPGNIICVCPTCHRVIYYGSEKELDERKELKFRLSQGGNMAKVDKGGTVTLNELKAERATYQAMFQKTDRGGN